MRISSIARSTLRLAGGLAIPVALLAQEGEAHATPSLLSPNPGLMVWTLVIFLGLLFILGRYAYPKILGAVEARERALQEAIDAARRDRDEAARVMEEYRRQIEGARAEAQRLIGEARQAGEQVRTGIIEQAHTEQQQMLERARVEIALERDNAIALLRRETVDLALRGASKVIEKNLDDADNRRLVEQFLSSVATSSR
jgi:F-type H+-transporting ATPase subunit b